MRLIDADVLRAEYQAILDRGDMFCEYDIIGMVDNAPTVEHKCIAKVTFDEEKLEELIADVVRRIQSGEIVIQAEISEKPRPFRVIDDKTGKEADEYEIALKENWAARSLVYCDMEGFFIGADGETLILADECGRFEYADTDRFKVVFDKEDEDV